MDLESAFNAIASPESEPGSPLYAVSPVAGFGGYLVGKDQEGFACLLVSTTELAAGTRPPIRLETVDVQFDLPCRLKKASDAARDGVLTVIRCRSFEQETVRYFL